MGNTSSSSRRSKKDGSLTPRYLAKAKDANTFDGKSLETYDIPEVVFVKEDEASLLAPPIPPCSKEMLDTIAAGNFKDRPVAEAINILNLVRSIFEAPIVLIAIFGDKKVYVRESIGLSAESVPYDLSICAWLMSTSHPKTLAVEDIAADNRFKKNCVLRQMGVRAYCGAPLIASNGHRLGSIAFMDMKPRSFNVRTCQLLNNFAELVVRELEQDIALQLQQMRSGALQQVYSQLVRGLDCFSKPLLLLEATRQRWVVLHSNQAWSDLTGMKRDVTTGRNIWSLFEHSDGTQVGLEKMRSAFEDGGVFSVEDVRTRGVSHSRPLTLTFRPASEDNLDQHTPNIGIPLSLDPGSNTQARQFYFMSVEYRDHIPRTLSAKSKPVRSVGKTPRSRNLMDMPVPGLRMGPLMAATSYGKVYRGTWYGSDVVVQVVLEDVVNGKDLRSVLGPQLSHPNVVSTLTVANGIAPGTAKETRSSSTGSITRSSSDCLDNSGDSLSYSSSSVADSATSLEDREGSLESWIVMEYCDKGMLMDGLEHGWLHPPGHSLHSTSAANIHVLATLLEVASAMAYLHERGVVHGNLSMCSVLLTSRGSNSGLCQRGFVAKVTGVGRQCKSYDTICYSRVLPYTAPEVLCGNSPSQAADVYSFGVLMWGLATRQRPWERLSIEELKHQRPPLCCQTTPMEFQSVVHKCLAHVPASRPTFQYLCTTLQDMLAIVESGLESEAAIAEPRSPPAADFIQSL